MEIESIWLKYRHHLKTFLQSKISNPTDVEDLLQEILLKSYKSLNTLKENSSIKPWLFQIANRTVIDFYRKNGSHSAVNADDLWYEGNTHDISVELSNCITPFIEALPEDMAALLRVVEIEGKSQKAYADELGIKYSTLKSRVQKSRKALRLLFDQCCHYSLDHSGNLMDFERKSNHCNNC